MTSSFLLDSAQIVAAVVLPNSKAVFSKGNLVLQAPDGELLQVRSYLTNGMVQGSRLTSEDMVGLVRTGQAVRAELGAPMSPHIGVWVLRRHMPRFEQCLNMLRNAAILVDKIQVGADDAWLCLVDESETASTALLEQWQNRALNEARALAQTSEWKRAEREAAAAHALAPGLDAESLAMWALCLEHIGQAQRARGLEAVARNSRGPEFAEEMQYWLQKVQSAVAAVPSRTQRNVLGDNLSNSSFAPLVGPNVNNEVYYYDVGEGRWQGKFDFQITAWRQWWATDLSARNTALSLLLHTAGQLPGDGEIRAEILCDPDENSGVARFEVSVHRFGIEIYRLRGHNALDKNGRDVDIHIRHRYGPPGFPWFSKRASADITNAGFTGTYRMRLVGQPFEGVYQIAKTRTEMKGVYTAEWATCVEHMYRTVPLKPERGMARIRWRTLLDSARELEPMARKYDISGHPLAPFCHIYAFFIRELAYKLEDCGFEDPEWIVRLGKTFVTIFVEAMAAATDPDGPEASGWTIALELFARHELTVLDQLGLCVLVHISNDLPKALALVRLRDSSGRSRIKDYHRINEVLINSIDGMQDRLSARYNPIAGILDGAAGRMDERLTADIIRYARSVAWYDAERLTDPESKRDAIVEMRGRIHTACARLQGRRPLARLALRVTRWTSNKLRRRPRHPEPAREYFGSSQEAGPQWADALLAANTQRGQAANRVDLASLHDYLHKNSADTLLSTRDAQRLAALLTAQGQLTPQDLNGTESPARWGLAAALLDTPEDPTIKLQGLGVSLEQAQRAKDTETALVGILRGGFDTGQEDLRSAIGGLSAVGVPTDAVVTALDNVDGGYMPESDSFRASAAALSPVPFDQVKHIVDPNYWDEVITHVEDARWLSKTSDTEGVVYERINLFTPWIRHHPLVLENTLNAKIIENENESRVNYELLDSIDGTFDLAQGFISVCRVDAQHTLVLVDKHIRVTGHPLLYALLRFNPDGLCALLTHWIHEAADRAKDIWKRDIHSNVPSAVNPRSHPQSVRRPQ